MNADQTMDFILPFADFDVDRILGKLPSGRAMSWLATDRKTGDPVVIKEVGFAEGSNPQAWVGRAWPGWSTIREVRPKGRTGIYVRDFVAGAPLRAPAQPRPIRECLELIAGIAETLKPLHASGGFHGRLKPANLIVAQGVPLPYITDPAFDPQNAAPKPSGDDTSDNGMAFDPHYVAPEQVRHGQPSAATDVYSLGCILYEQLTGKKPFTSGTPLMTCYQQAMTPMPSPSIHGVTLDRDTLALLKAMMAKNPAERPPNAIALAERLRPLLDSAFDPGAMTGTFVMPKALLDKALKGKEGGKVEPAPLGAETVQIKAASETMPINTADVAAHAARKAAVVADASIGKEQETVVFTPDQLKSLFDNSTPLAAEDSHPKIRLNDSARIPIVETVAIKLEDLKAARDAEERARAAQATPKGAPPAAAPAKGSLKQVAASTEAIDLNATQPLPAGFKPGMKPPAETATLPASAAADAMKKAVAAGPPGKAAAETQQVKPEPKAKSGGMGIFTILLLLYSLVTTLLLLGAAGYIFYLLQGQAGQ